MLFAAHSGLRFLVLLAGLFVILYALVGFFGKREYSTAMARLATVFAGLLHLQVLTGVAVLFARPFYTQLIGHLFMMVMAAAVAQFVSTVMKRRPPGEEVVRPAPGGRRAGAGPDLGRDRRDRAGGAAEHDVGVGPEGGAASGQPSRQGRSFRRAHREEPFPAADAVRLPRTGAYHVVVPLRVPGAKGIHP